MPTIYLEEIDDTRIEVLDYDSGYLGCVEVDLSDEEFLQWKQAEAVQLMLKKKFDEAVELERHKANIEFLENQRLKKEQEQKQREEQKRFKAKILASFEEVKSDPFEVLLRYEEYADIDQPLADLMLKVFLQKTSKEAETKRNQRMKKVHLNETNTVVNTSRRSNS